MLKFKKEAAIDAFLVGGGGGGGGGVYAPGTNDFACGGGGGGGYTGTLINIVPRANTEYPIVIGAGGTSALKGGDTIAFGKTVNGGAGGEKALNSTTKGSGGNGGSGGGAGGSDSYKGGNGGSNGDNGESAGNTSAGSGQGTTTREFGEASGRLYAGGGGGGGSTGGTGGSGGGGNGSTRQPLTGATGGADNTGGGGGGERSSSGAAGGSGIVCIRLHKKKEGLQFNYTGQYNERLDDRVVELYTGGVFTVPRDVLVDLFLVGGGGAGGQGNSSAGSNAWPGGGGGGGYTKTINSFSLHAGTKYTVVIGNGGSTHGADGESTSFGINSVLGGKGGYESTDINNPHAGAGGAGGSGGGGAVSGSSVIGSGGSDGSDGSTGYPVTAVYGIGGKGQGTTTREFGEPTGKLYAGGGGGGRHSTSDNNQPPGGEGGGGTGSWSGSYARTDWVAGTPGEPRTGGGGGGGVWHQTTTSSAWQDSSAAGGSGIVCVRLHKEKLDFTYTGDYTEREDGVVELKSSGALAFQNPAVIDVFMVGGGGSGLYKDVGISAVGYGGGGGGYARTFRRVNVAANSTMSITVGAGASNSTANGGTSAFGDTMIVQGGSSATSPETANLGGNGGSGGGGGVNSNSDYGAGGTNGGNGETGYPSSNAGGAGQGTTTREFGEIAGKLYAGGGGGGRYLSAQSPVISMGGTGGGGSGGWASSTAGQYQMPSAGGANTGGGGGGGVHTANNAVQGASGGSGIVCFRVSAPLPELAGTWVLNERLYAPENDFDETTSYRFKVGTIECTRIRTSNLTHLTAYKVFSGDTVDIYTFSTNTWKTTARNLTFPAGATASDEFRAWLASNATKQ